MSEKHKHIWDNVLSLNLLTYFLIHYISTVEIYYEYDIKKNYSSKKFQDVMI